MLIIARLKAETLAAVLFAATLTLLKKIIPQTSVNPSYLAVCWNVEIVSLVRMTASVLSSGRLKPLDATIYQACFVPVQQYVRKNCRYANRHVASLLKYRLLAD